MPAPVIQVKSVIGYSSPFLSDRAVRWRRWSDVQMPAVTRLLIGRRKRGCSRRGCTDVMLFLLVLATPTCIRAQNLHGVRAESRARRNPSVQRDAVPTGTGPLVARM